MSNEVHEVQGAHRAATVEAVVPMAADALFELLTTPARHAELDGGGTVLEQVHGPARLERVGDRFAMKNKRGLSYQTTNVVTALEPGRLVEWQGILRHRWRWELEPVDAGHTRVRESYVYGTSALQDLFAPLGLVKGAVKEMTATLARLGR